MSFSYQPESGVLSGTSFESQSETFLQRAALGSLPSSSSQSLSTSGAPNSGYYAYKSFVAPSGGWYSITCNLSVKIVNTTNGMASNAYIADEGDYEGSCIMPVSAGQSVTIYWVLSKTPDIRFVPAVEA